MEKFWKKRSNRPIEIDYDTPPEVICNWLISELETSPDHDTWKIMGTLLTLSGGKFYGSTGSGKLET